MSKLAVVTGGTHGIGLATVRALRKMDAEVISISRHPPENDPDVIQYVCDVMDEMQVMCCIDAIAQLYPRVDILVNNVGGGGRWGTEDPIAVSPLLWEEVMQKNFSAALRFTNGFVPGMVSQGWGRVVTVSSMFGREAGGRPWFTVAKAAQIALMKSYAKMFAKFDITFNSVAPGPILIEGTGWEGDSAIEYGKTLPAGRMGTPEEVASVIAFLCSDAASWVNGACIPVDGAQSASF